MKIGIVTKSRSMQRASRKNEAKLDPKASARVYVMQANEDDKAFNVITCKFSLFDNSIHALIDPWFIHSYICDKFVDRKFLKLSLLRLA